MEKPSEKNLAPVDPTILRFYRLFWGAIALLSLAATPFLSPKSLGPVLAGISAVAFLLSYITLSPRVVGWFGLAFGLSIAGFANFASTETLSSFAASAQLSTGDKAEVAASYLQDFGGATIASAISLLLLNPRDGAINPKIESAAGWIGIVATLAFIMMLIIWPAGFEIGPLIFIAVTLIGCAADIANKKWKTLIAWAAGAAAGLILANLLYPGWQELALSRGITAWEMVARYSHADMVWPIIIAGAATALQCVNARTSWRAGVATTLLVMSAVWLTLLAAYAGEPPSAG